MPFSKLFNDPAWQAQICASLELEQRITDLGALLPDYTANIDPELLERMKRLAPSLSGLSELEQRITTDSSTSDKEIQRFTDIYASNMESGEKSVRQFEEQRQYKDKRQKDIAKLAYLEALRELEAEKQAKKAQPQAKSGANDGKNKLRTDHVKKWVKDTKYTGGKFDKTINAALKAQEPGLWGDTIDTFRKWIQSDEAMEAKALLPNKRRK